MSAIIGHIPQDGKFRPSTRSGVRIGKKTVIRELVTIHRGTEEESQTVIGDNCYLMSTAHVGHNCRIGNNVILVNAVLLAGHVQVADHAFIGGGSAVHQFCRIGTLAMIGGLTRVNKDVPPFMLVRGDSLVYSLNLVGVRRAGFSREKIAALKEAFKVLYVRGLNRTQALARLETGEQPAEVAHLIDFIKKSPRGICECAFRNEDAPGTREE